MPTNPSTRLRNGFFCGLLLASTSARAEPKDTNDLETIIITATRTRKSLETVPGSVSYVTKDDMEKRDVQAVDQALNVLPGVFDRRGKGLMDTSAAVTLRGIPDQKRTLVLFDGIPANDAYTGAVSYGGLSVEDIQGIEVLRGPFSSLYGGNAMGGVVNIIPRQPQTREFALRSGYGTGWYKDGAMDNIFKEYASYGDRFKDKLSIFFSYGYKGTDGYPSDFNTQSSKPAGLTGWSDTTDNQGKTKYLIGDKGANGWKQENLSFRAWYDFSAISKLNLTYTRTSYDYTYGDPRSYLKNTAGADAWTYGTVKEASFLTGPGGMTQNFISAKSQTQWADANIALSLGILDAEKSWYVTPGASAATTRAGGPGTVSQTPADAYSADIQVAFPQWMGKHVFVVGTSLRQASAHTRQYNLANWLDEKALGALSYESRGTNRDYAAYVQDELTLRDDLTAYLGVRGDWWRTFDGYADQPGTAGYPINYGRRDASALSPKAAVVYRPFDRTTFRLSGGKAFRAPTVYELYRTWTSGTVVYSANPGLQPESTWSWDAEATQKLWQDSEFKASYFEHHLKDLIYRQAVSSTLQQYVNAGKALIRGVELEGEQRLFSRLRFYANFTLNDAKITDNPAKTATVGKKLVDVPEKMYSFGGDVELGAFTASATGRYVAKRYTDDANADTVNGVYGSRDAYLTLDSKVSYRATKNATVSLAVNNITNERYFDYYRAPGRNWFAELAMRF